MARRKSHRQSVDKIAEKRPKTQYLKKDNIILRVAAYLSPKEDGATIYNIISERGVIGLSKQDQTRFTEKIMNSMERDGWIKKVSYSTRVSVYFITEKGKSAVSDALQLRSDGSLLATLEAFRDLVQT